MKRSWILWAALTALFLCPSTKADAAAGGQVQADTSFAIPAGGNVASGSTISIRTDGFDWASVQMLITSATFSAANFTDGSKSTATITVSSAPIGGFVYPGQICIAGVCATYQIGLSVNATSQYIYPYDANGISSNTAQGICNWILGNNQLQGEVTCNCPAGQSVIYTTSTATGIGVNYPVFSSSATQVGFGAGKIGSGFMTGGSSSTYAYNGANIYLPGQKYPTGMGVYFSTASAPTQSVFYSTASVGGTAVALQMGVTFYAINVDPNDIAIATTQANAVAGQFLTFISSNSGTTANTFTLNVPASAGTVALKWMVSNDDVNWIPFTTTVFGQAVAAPSFTGSATWTDLGHLDSSWFGIGVTPPTSGAINIQSRITGSTY